MILCGGRIIGFGRLVGLALDFAPGLNLVFAPNEGGKSTLQRFLTGMLYGQLRPDLKQQRRLEPWVERYRPWGGAEYGGILRCRLGDGREVEISRTFGTVESRLEIRTVTGEDIADRYDRQRNGESLFADTHLGLSKSLFESLGVIREGRAAEIDDSETIRDRLASLAQSGDEELSVRQALEALEGKLDEIGSDRAPTKPYRQTQDLVAALKAELKEFQDTRMRHDGWLEDRNRLAAQVAELEQRLAATRYALLAARLRETERRVEALEAMERELSDLRAEREQTEGRTDFPVNGVEEVNQLEGALQGLKRHCGEVRADREKAEADFEGAASERKRLESYSDLAAGSGEEVVSEWFNFWLDLSIRRDVLRKGQEDLRMETEAVLRQCVGQKEDTAQAEAAMAALKRRAGGRMVFGVLLLVAATLPFAARFVDGFGSIPLRYAVGVGALAAAVAVACLVAASRRFKAVTVAKESWAGFVEKLALAERQTEQLQGQIEDYYQKLKDVLESVGESVGLDCSPANLKVQIDTLWKNLRRFREADTRYAACRERVRELQGRDAEITKEYETTRARIDALLQEACVASPGEFRNEERKSKRLVGLMEKEASVTREFERLSEGRTPQQWRARMEDIAKRLTGADGDGRGTPEISRLADVSGMEQEEKRLTDKLSSRREEHARLAEQVRQAFAGRRPVSDIEEDLALAERDLKELETDRRALGIALETIRELAHRRQTELAPQLNAAAGQRFLRLCPRYDEVRIAPDFTILVRESETGKLRHAGHLSRGAQEQLYFATRFGILDLISQSSEPCPCLMDEPFASYDRPRLAGTFEILTEESERRQLVVFTCRDDLREFAERNGAHILHLP